MSILLICIISLVVILIAPGAIIFLLCFFLGVIVTVFENIAKTEKPQPSVSFNPKAEAAKIILRKIERPSSYKLH